MPLLTATASVSVRKEILKVAHMRNVEIIKLSLEKQNIKYMVENVENEVEEVFNKLLTELKNENLPRRLKFTTDQLMNVVNRSVFLTSI